MASLAQELAFIEKYLPVLVEIASGAASVPVQIPAESVSFETPIGKITIASPATTITISKSA